MDTFIGVLTVWTLWIVLFINFGPQVLLWALVLEGVMWVADRWVHRRKI